MIPHHEYVPEAAIPSTTNIAQIFSIITGIAHIPDLFTELAHMSILGSDKCYPGCKSTFYCHDY